MITSGTYKKIDARRSIVPNEKVIARANTVLGDMYDDKEKEEELKHKAGRKSYVFKAKEQGLYFSIKHHIRNFRAEHKDTGFKELYEFIQPLFPSVFPKNMNSGNFGTHIQQDKGWCSAYYSSNGTLLDLAEERLWDVLENETTEAKDIINAYDKVKRYSLAEKQIEIDDSDCTVIFGFKGCGE